jgi:hypothetical protein
MSILSPGIFLALELHPLRPEFSGRTQLTDGAK